MYSPGSPSSVPPALPLRVPLCPASCFAAQAVGMSGSPCAHRAQTAATQLLGSRLPLQGMPKLSHVPLVTNPGYITAGSAPTTRSHADFGTSEISLNL